MAFPLIVHRDHERRTLTVIEEPTFPIIGGLTYYYAADEPGVRFNFEGKCGISRDACVAVPGRWVDGHSAG